MNLKTILGYTAIPAAVGAVSALAAQKLGYDMPALEGARQLVLAGLPIAMIGTASKQSMLDSDYDYKTIQEDANRFTIEHPYLTPILGAGINAGLICLGSIVMERLTGTDLSQKFISAAGGLEGAISGVTLSIMARRNA